MKDLARSATADELTGLYPTTLTGGEVEELQTIEAWEMGIEENPRRRMATRACSRSQQ
jgi:hypothetical protein